MGNGLYRIIWPGIHSDRRTEVHPTVLRDVTTAASVSEAHAVEHAEVKEPSGPNRYITNRKSHTGFRLVPTSMTLNDLERRNSPYFAFFTQFDRFPGRLHHSG